MVGCLLSLSLFLYCRKAKKIVDVEVILVITKEIYWLVFIERVILLYLLALKNGDPFFLFLFLSIFDWMISIVTFLVRLIKLEIGSPILTVMEIHGVPALPSSGGAPSGSGLINPTWEEWSGVDIAGRSYVLSTL